MTLENYIGGKFIPSRRHRANINPSNTNDVIGEFPRSEANDIEEAVAAARSAHPEWSRTSPQRRADILEKIASGILAQAEVLADLLSREEGKTVREALGEVARAGHIFRFFSGEALRMTGTRQESTREDVLVNITRESCGVIGIVTPWNFPMAIPSWKTAPALAFGNTVVLKPAEITPASTHALAEIMHEAGLPAGVFNLVMGQGSVLGSALVENEGVDALTFTGSEKVGSRLAVKAAERLMPLQLEMGGKNPLVVTADADIGVAVQCAIDGAFFATGQRCTASSRLIVDNRVHDEFVERMLTCMSELVVGDARDPGTTIGPVVDERQLTTDLEYLQLARTESSVVHGGDQVERSTPGHYLTPALITGATNEDRTSREEIFGPVASVIQVSGYEEALSVANDTPFGLVGGICTTSLRLAEDFQRNAQAGMVMVNLPTAGVDPHVPFGGRRRSSFGPKEQGVAAREFYTQLKTSYVAP